MNIVDAVWLCMCISLTLASYILGRWHGFERGDKWHQEEHTNTNNLLSLSNRNLNSKIERIKAIINE